MDFYLHFSQVTVHHHRSLRYVSLYHPHSYSRRQRHRRTLNIKATFHLPSCLMFTGYSPWGSKIVFMSYKDEVGQIQKFAVRFLTTYEAERFINIINETFGHESINGSTLASLNPKRHLNLRSSPLLKLKIGILKVYPW